jgi:Tfp pilus assembly protein PilO
MAFRELSWQLSKRTFVLFFVSITAVNVTVLWAFSGRPLRSTTAHDADKESRLRSLEEAQNLVPAVLDNIRRDLADVTARSKKTEAAIDLVNKRVDQADMKIEGCGRLTPAAKPQAGKSRSR